MNPRRSTRLAQATLVAALLAGCRHAVAPRPPAGASSYRFVEPPPTARPIGNPQPAEALVPIDALVSAEPLGTLDTPRYPAEAQGRLGVPVTLQMTLTIGTNGRVGDVRPSALALAAPTPYDAEFRAAIMRAVARWHFLPAERRHLVPGWSDGKPIWIVTATEKVESELDVAFTFSATGSVVALPRR